MKPNAAMNRMRLLLPFGLAHGFLCAAAAAGNASEAIRINRRLVGLHRHLFCEANPIPVKWAVAEMGLMSHGQRLPLTALAPAFHERVRAAMQQAGL